MDYSWITALAQYKQHNMTHLSLIDLDESISSSMEIDFAVRRRPRIVLELVEWQYPPDIIEAFRVSDIKLKVILRAASIA